MAKAQKYYVVWRGRETGVFDNWMAVKPLIDGYNGPQYKSFTSLEDAQKAFAEGWKPQVAAANRPTTDKPSIRAIAVDAACSGNPGKMEYRGVSLWDRKEIFHVRFEIGTNNIGEFLAIVHGLAVLRQKNAEDITIYSDSQIAIGWIRGGKCRTKLDFTPRTAELFDTINRAEKWLAANPDYKTPIVKWPTEDWGEIPADFGRKN